MDKEKWRLPDQAFEAPGAPVQSKLDRHMPPGEGGVGGVRSVCTEAPLLWGLPNGLAESGPFSLKLSSPSARETGSRNSKALA